MRFADWGNGSQTQVNFTSIVFGQVQTVRLKRAKAQSRDLPPTGVKVNYTQRSHIKTGHISYIIRI